MKQRMQVQMPQFLVDLFGDLRDRHLLPVVGVLLVAIIAVPVALSSSGTKPAAPQDATSAAAVPRDSQSRVAVVAASDPGVRELKERLAGRGAKNPFKQHLPAQADAGTSDLGSTTVVQPTPAASSGGGSSTQSGSTNTGSSGAKSGSPGSSTNQGQTGDTKATFASYAVDAKVGEPGDLKDRNDLNQLDLLPNAAVPVFVFMGVSNDGKKALFLVSNVVSLSGSGSCLVTVAICQLVALKEGDQADILYALNLKTYRLKVTSIRKVTG